MVHHPGIQDIHETRLVALLEGLLKENKVTGTAKILGVDRSSIYRSIRSHHLNPVVKKQLEEYLLNNGSPEGFKGDQAGPDDTAMMVEELRREVAELKQALERKDQEWEQGERALRAAVLSVAQEPPGALPASVPPAPAPGIPPGYPRPLLPEVPTVVEAPGPGTIPPPNAQLALMRYPSLVSPDPLPGGGAVYGAAEPLVREWWLVKEAHGNAVTNLDLAATEERQMELEILLIEDHNLTLPRAERSYDDFQRHRETGLRHRALQRARRARREAQRNRRIIRIISLGLFRPPRPIWPPVTAGAADRDSTTAPGHPAEYGD